MGQDPLFGGPFKANDIAVLPGSHDSIAVARHITASPPEAGNRGRKDGQGLYRWEDGKPIKPPLAKDYKAPADLEDRLILPLLNEAVAALHDGVVADADLLDAGVIFGTGFAPFRGGPLWYAAHRGATTQEAAGGITR